jgi:hypothetical protein
LIDTARGSGLVFSVGSDGGSGNARQSRASARD